MNLRRLVPLLALVFGLTFAGCFSTGPEEQASGGSGGEIVGTAQHEDTTQGSPKRLASARSASGLPVVLGSVFAYPKSFLPDTSAATIAILPKVYTDSTGAFRVTGVGAGTYVLEVNDGSGKGVAKNVNIPADSTVVDVGTVVVKQTGAIQLSVQFSAPGSPLYYVSLKGTRLVARGTSAGIELTIDDIPSGVEHTVNVRVYSPSEVAGSYDVATVTVSPGVTTALNAITIP